MTDVDSCLVPRHLGKMVRQKFRWTVTAEWSGSQSPTACCMVTIENSSGSLPNASAMADEQFRQIEVCEARATNKNAASGPVAYFPPGESLVPRFPVT